MKKTLLKLLVMTALSSLVTLTAYAADVDTSYDYGVNNNNKLSVENGGDLGGVEQELTVLLVKDYAEGKAIKADDIFYVNQTKSDSFASAFKDLGLKGGALEPGVYTLILGGENIGQAKKAEVVVGNIADDKNIPSALRGKNVTYYKVSRVRTRDDGNKFDYACLLSFDGYDPDNDYGVVLQYVDETKNNNNVMKMYIGLGDMGTGALVEATYTIGIQINDIPDANSNAFSVIPCSFPKA